MADDAALYPIAVLIDELKNENPQVAPPAHVTIILPQWP